MHIRSTVCHFSIRLHTDAKTSRVLGFYKGSYPTLKQSWTGWKTRITLGQWSRELELGQLEYGEEDQIKSCSPVQGRSESNLAFVAGTETNGTLLEMKSKKGTISLTGWRQSAKQLWPGQTYINHMILTVVLTELRRFECSYLMRRGGTKLESRQLTEVIKVKSDNSPITEHPSDSEIKYAEYVIM